MILQEAYSVPIPLQLDSLLNNLFKLTRTRTRKHQSSALLALYEGNPLAICGFPSQRASIAENVLMSRRHHEDELDLNNQWGLLQPVRGKIKQYIELQNDKFPANTDSLLIQKVEMVVLWQNT